MEAANTKELILFRAVALFADRGYDSISMVNIAKSVGIKPANIYNHYESKESILDSAYQFYFDHYLDTRPTQAQYDPILKSGTAEEIVSIFNYPLAEPMEVMFALVRIIYSRIYIDQKVRELYQERIHQESIRYIMEVLSRACAIGRMQLKPEEIETMAYILLSARSFGANAVIGDPDQGKWRVQETRVLNTLTKLLVLSPPIV